MSNRGVYMIAFGERAQMEARHAGEAIRKHSNLPVKMISNAYAEDMTDKQASRWYKSQMFIQSECDNILYLDADARPQADISAGFDALDHGYDIAMTPSQNQGREAFWHVSSDEREATLEQWGFTPLQLQCGVMFVAKNERTEAFMDAWRDEWYRWKDEDQAAFMRALKRVPLKIWLLGYPWNGGAVIAHRFGACR